MVRRPCACGIKLEEGDFLRPWLLVIKMLKTTTIKILLAYIFVHLKINALLAAKAIQGIFLHTRLPAMCHVASVAARRHEARSS